MRPVGPSLLSMLLLATLIGSACTEDRSSGRSAAPDVTAAGAAGTATTADEEVSAPQTPTSPPTGQVTSSGSTARTALDTAARTVTGGRPFDLEVDVVAGQPVYEVKVAHDGVGTELVVDATGTQLVSTRPIEVFDEDVTRLDAARLSADEALERAGEMEPDAELREIEIDSTDDGTVVWQVELTRPDRARVELALDARTGQLVGAVRPD